MALQVTARTSAPSKEKKQTAIQLLNSKLYTVKRDEHYEKKKIQNSKIRYMVHKMMC